MKLHQQAAALGAVFLSTGILTWGRTPFDAPSIGLGIGLFIIAFDLRRIWKRRARSARPVESEAPP